MNFAKYRVQLSTEKKYSSKYEYKYEYEYFIPAGLRFTKFKFSFFTRAIMLHAYLCPNGLNTRC